MTTPFLTSVEIAELDELFLIGFHAIDELRGRSPVGRGLHAVKVPPRLSESIVAHHRCQMFGPETEILARNGRHDLTVRTRRRRLNVAVKGSGMADWAVITPTDSAADVLVWVDYHDRLLDPTAPVVLRRIPITRVAGTSTRAFLRSVATGCPALSVWPRWRRAIRGLRGPAARPTRPGAARPLLVPFEGRPPSNVMLSATRSNSVSSPAGGPPLPKCFSATTRSRREHGRRAPDRASTRDP